jgi:D-aspartate ligase
MEKMDLQDIPQAVVTGADHPTALGTARALKKIRDPRIRVLGLCANQDSPTCKSSVWDRLIPVSSEPKILLDQLIRIGQVLSPNRPVLYPSQDDVVKLVSDHREELTKYFRFVYPSQSTVDLLIDKAAFHRWAGQAGFPIPESNVVHNKGELLRLFETVEFPVVLKPTVRTQKWDLISPQDKVFVLNRPADLESVGFDLFEVCPQFLAQQWIEGGDSDVHFCLIYIDKHGKELGHFTGRKLVQWPRDCGSTAVTISSDNPELHELTRRVFAKADYMGLGSLEAKWSHARNRFYITEPTVGRNDLQSYLAVGGGVNLAALAFFDAAMDQNPMLEKERRPVIWINEYLTIQAWLGPKGGRVGSAKISSNLKRKMLFAYFDFKDPSPFIALCWYMARKQLRRILKMKSRTRSKSGD